MPDQPHSSYSFVSGSSCIGRIIADREGAARADKLGPEM
jgi:hypothetical protein